MSEYTPPSSGNFKPMTKAKLRRIQEKMQEWDKIRKEIKEVEAKDRKESEPDVETIPEGII